MATIDDRLFRWKMTYRHYKKVLSWLEKWQDLTAGEIPDAAQAASLDIAAQWLEAVDHPEMAQLLRQERDQLVERVRAPMQIRLRAPRGSRQKPQREDDRTPEYLARIDRADARLAGFV